MDRRTDISQTSDLLQLRELIDRYFHGLDARDRESLVASFAPGATATYFHGTPQAKHLGGGGPAIADHFMHVVSQFDASTHLAANVVLQVSGDSAKGDTFAIAYVLVGGSVLARGLRYMDEFVRVEDGWRIQHRNHIPLWQFNAPAVEPFVPQ